MIYAMSDIHGCYAAYQSLLEKIQFSDEDILYVVGDAIDRGEESIRLLKDMMLRPNVIPIAGNHEFMAMKVLKKFCVEITEDTAENYLSTEDMVNYTNWYQDGGDRTMEQFRKLTDEEQMDILDYLSEFSLYEEVSCGGRDYILAHGGFEPFVPGKPLEEYDISEILFRSPDYEKVYFPDKYLVTGHTPTVKQGEEYRGKILQKNHHIALDCGCVFGMALGVYCLDTGEVWYEEMG